MITTQQQKLANRAFALVAKSNKYKNATINKQLNAALYEAQTAHLAGNRRGNLPTFRQILNAALKYYERK